MLDPFDQEELEAKIHMDGLDSCIRDHDWSHVEDETFHELMKEYLDISEQLLGYIMEGEYE